MDALEKIKFLRKTNKLTQAQVATAIGISGPNYSRYESGEWNFTIKHILKLAHFYNVSVSYLLNENEKDEITISLNDYKKLKEASDVIIKIGKAMKD